MREQQQQHQCRLRADPPNVAAVIISHHGAAHRTPHLRVVAVLVVSLLLQLCDAVCPAVLQCKHVQPAGCLFQAQELFEVG
jgi:hypothetical protein